MLPIPKLKDLNETTLTDLQSKFGVTIADKKKVSLRAFSGVLAGKLYLFYLSLAKVQKNIFVDTADSELKGGTLERFGRVKLNRNPFPAQAGQYTAEVTGQIGAVIAAQSTFKSDPGSLNPGFTFILDNAFTLASTTDVITIRSLTSGIVAKLAVDDTLTPNQPIALVNSAQGSVKIIAEVVQPKAAETLEEYRAKVLEAYRLEAQGGAASDYRLWSFDVQGVLHVYPYAQSGIANSAIIYIEATIADSIDGKGTPSQLMLDEVREVIEFDPDDTRPTSERGRRPITVDPVDCIAITPLDIDITILSYSGLTVEIQEAIAIVIDDEIKKIRPFIAGCDVLAEKNDIIDLNKIAYMIISAVPGSLFAGVELKVDGVTVTTYQFTLGYIPYKNSITYA